MAKDDPLVCQEDRVHVDLGMVYLLPDVELNLFVRSEKLDNICRGLAHKINLDSLSMVIAGKALPSWCPLRIWAKLRDSLDRKSTRLNSSHANISYAVFCLKKQIKNH